MKKIIKVLVLFIIVVVLFACEKSYKVTFKDSNGNVLQEVEVVKGSEATGPSITPPEGYEFVGWSSNVSCVTSDLEVTPVFEVIKLNVVFKDLEGNVISSVVVDYNTNATAPNVPAIEGKTFTGWDKSLENIKEDLEVKPIYDNVLLDVVFKDLEGNVILTEKVEYGNAATAPNAPVVEGKTFIGWDKDLSNIVTNLEVKPVYEVAKFTVTFKDKDGIVLSTETVEYGQTSNAPKAPVVEGYEFISWDNSFENVKDNIEVNAIYELKQYTVTIMTSLGDTISVIEVEHGKTLDDIIPVDIEGYQFIKWSEEGVVITQDTTIIAEYEALTYSIKYYDGESELDLEPKTHTYNTITSLPNYSKEGKFFAGWFEKGKSDKVVSLGYNVSGDKEFVAKWEDLPSYKCPVGTFTFKSIKSGPHSSNPNLIIYQPDFTNSGAPNTGVTSYNWSTGDSKVATISTYSTISIVSSGVTYIKAELKSDPTKVGYVLIKTSTDGVVAVTEAEANKFISYTVKFEDADGNLLSEQTVKEGGNAVVPDIPLVEGKVFDGWSGKFYDVKADITVKAKYRTGTNKYAGKTVSILGDSMSTYQTIVPEGYSCFYPYSTADVNNYNDTWWMQVINRFGMKLLMNNSYSGTCVSTGTGNYSTTIDSRLDNLLKDGEKPDVIIIFMGANDCGSQYVQLSTFKSSYKTMLEKIQKLCPDSEIICLTLPKAKMYTDANRADYSKVIMDTATEFNCKLVNLENAWDPTNFDNLLCDSIHPKKAGMDKIYETIYYSIRN